MAENFIRRRRKEIALTQEELAARLQSEGVDVSPASVSHWETGRYEPPLHESQFRRALARALRMSVYDLLIAAGYEVKQSPHSEAAERAAFIIDQLPPDKQHLALGILEQFLSNN